MTDIPIIFSAPMVKAMLDGRKTMTRRLAWRDPGPSKDEYRGGKPNPLRVRSSWQNVEPGDRLWVREALIKNDHVRYAADGNVILLRTGDDENRTLAFRKWAVQYRERTGGIPSIHMPRWASRLTLEVTAMKIERLQDISEADAIAEGVQKNITGEFGIIGPNGGWLGTTFATAAEAFKYLWMSLHGVKSWDENPEVVAIASEVHKANIDALPKAA